MADQNLLDRAIFGTVRRLPGPAVAALALLFYPGGGLLLPLALHWQPVWILEANILGTVLAVSLGMAWLLLQIDARDRRHLVDWTSDLRLLDAQEFEWLVGEVFRREGWLVQETGGQNAPDGNIDLKLSRNGQRKLVQCKRWQSRLVGVDEVREFMGTLAREGLPGGAGIFVTTAKFTEQAGAEAKKMKMTLVDGIDLAHRVDKVRRAEACSICSAPMIVDLSRHGWWLRCIALGCKGKRDLGNEPGRAVELLTRAA